MFVCGENKKAKVGRRIKLDGWGYGLYRSFAGWAILSRDEKIDIPLQTDIAAIVTKRDRYGAEMRE